MATKTDYTAQAQAFLRLWQDQMHQQMTNPDAIKTMLAAMHRMSGGTNDTPRNPTHAPADGDDAIGLFDARLKRVERQLERLAKRLDEIHAATRAPRRNANKSNAKRVAKPRGAKRRAAKKPTKRK
ncbi:MAG: hypothetical protein ACOYJ2_03495 [Rickettsiales bacterium]